MQAFVVFSSAAGVACSGGTRFHSTGQPEQLSAKAGSLLWVSGTHPITNDSKCLCFPGFLLF